MDTPAPMLVGVFLDPNSDRHLGSDQSPPRDPSRARGPGHGHGSPRETPDPPVSTTKINPASGNRYFAVWSRPRETTASALALPSD
jgi:hypothetical protein